MLGCIFGNEIHQTKADKIVKKLAIGLSKDRQRRAYNCVLKGLWALKYAHRNLVPDIAVMSLRGR
jgi:hypothetical protein